MSDNKTVQERRLTPELLRALEKFGYSAEDWPTLCRKFEPQTWFEELVRLRPGTPEKWRLQGKGPSYFKFGSSVRYRVADVIEWLAGCERASTSDLGDSGANS